MCKCTDVQFADDRCSLYINPKTHSFKNLLIHITKQNMPSVTDQLSVVIEKTERLIALCNALQEENDLLKLENQSLGAALNVSKDKGKELEEKLRVLKLAKSFSETNEKNLDIKQKINEFVREIDKCIVLLKK